MIERINEQFFIFVPRLSFITVFSNASLDRHNQINYVVKTCILNREIYSDINTFIQNLHYLTNSNKPFNINYISNKYDYFTNWNKSLPANFNFRNINFNFFDIQSFGDEFTPFKGHEFPIKDRSLYIFCDFDN